MNASQTNEVTRRLTRRLRRKGLKAKAVESEDYEDGVFVLAVLAADLTSVTVTDGSD